MAVNRLLSFLKNTNFITRELCGQKMQNFQIIAFKWQGTNKKILKFTLRNF